MLKILVNEGPRAPRSGPKTTLGGPLGARLGARLGGPLIDKYF